jgi:hypothetical protein
MRSLLLLALLAAAPLPAKPADEPQQLKVTVDRSKGLDITVEDVPAEPPPPRPKVSRHYNTAPPGEVQGRRCELQVGPRDRLAQEGDVVVRRGEVIDAAFALHGNVTVEAGGTATSVVAVGGKVTVAGRVEEDAVAIRGEVVVRGSGRVGGDAVALAGRTRIEAGGQVEGDVTSIGPGFLVGDLADLALKELDRRGPCRVTIDPAAVARPR